MIGDKIRKRRKELGLSQTQVAEKAGCTYATVLNIEKGKLPNTSTLLNVLNAMGLELDTKEREELNNN